MPAKLDELPAVPVESLLTFLPSAGTKLSVPGIAVSAGPPLHMYLIEGACLLGVSSHVSLLLKDRCILNNATPGAAILSSIMRDVREYPRDLLKVVHKRGDYLSLCGPWCRDFWHWMQEYVPKLVLAEAAGYRGQYLAPAFADRHYIRETFELLRIPEERIECFDGGQLTIERLWVPQQVARDESAPRFAALMRFTRERLQQELARTFPDCPAAGDGRLYIPRRQPHRPRQVLNEDALLDELNARGFEAVCMEDLSLAEQLQRAITSRCVIGPHGAGMALALAMPKGAAVVELYGPNAFAGINAASCAVLGIEHYPVSRQDPGVGAYDNNADIEVDCGALRRILKEILRS